MRTWTLCCSRPLDLKLSVITAHICESFVIVKTINYSCTNYSNDKITNNELLIGPNRGFININKTIKNNNDMLTCLLLDMRHLQATWSVYKNLGCSKRFTTTVLFTQTFIHWSYNLGSSLLLKETSAGSLGFESICYRLLDDPLYLLSYSCPVV